MRLSASLSATERVEQHRGQLTLAAGPGAGDLVELMHAVWLAKKIIELVCSATVAQAAQDHTHELNRTGKEVRQADALRSPALTPRERQLRGVHGGGPARAGVRGRTVAPTGQSRRRRART
jgi:hypothetical protein